MSRSRSVIAVVIQPQRLKVRSYYHKWKAVQAVQVARLRVQALELCKDLRERYQEWSAWDERPKAFS